MKKNKGITLIALVITIIVLLILAAVSIATLTGKNGILTQANKAKIETRGASVEEECSLWKINQEMDNKTTEETAQTLDELLDSLEERNLITSEERATIKETGEITIGSRTINFGKEELPTVANKPGKPDLKTGLFTVSSTIDGKEKSSTNPTIPEGFKPVDEGLVIEDKDGNQFVWVPVKDFNKCKKENGYQDGAQQTCEFVSNEITAEKYYELVGNGETVGEGATGTEKEVQEMYKSVKDNGGFYIGRYEAGAEGGKLEYSDEINGKWIEIPKLVCKKEVAVYNCIKWGNSMEDETGGAVELARGFADQQGYNTNSVKSTLCYGVQWDAVMRWMEKVENPGEEIQDENNKYYIKDSTGMGWYKDNYSIGNPEHKTVIDMGESESNKVKNIYDMAGNVAEWTMEACGTYQRVGRGSNFYYYGSNSPASERGKETANYPSVYFGFRLALYLYS